MPLVLDQFVQWLADSGLMTQGEIDSVLGSLPPSDKPQSGEDLAKLLYRRGKLTKYQAEALYKGKTKGLVMGNYVVLDKIGQGGMGQVYRARHCRMNREVALKVLPSTFMNSQDAVKRFQREVEAAARLNHANVVTAHDADESNGLHFLVMEYVKGLDLSELVREKGPQPLGRAIEYTVQAAKGLEYAHGEGIVHRDIKPSNLLLDSKGTVKILDMGLARFEQEAKGDDTTKEARMTQTGQTLGTVDYLSPEQAMNARAADQQSDIYSLGCTFYYLLTGQPVYGGESLTERLMAHSTKEIPSLSKRRKDVPPALDKIFQKMVAKQTKDRYRTMRDVIADLEGCHLVLLEKGAAALEKVPERMKPEHEELHQASQPTVAPRGRGLSDTLSRGPAKSPSRSQARTGVTLDKRQIIIGSVAAGIVLLLLFATVLILWTSKGTIVVQIDEPDAVVSVDDGKLQFTTTKEAQSIEIKLKKGEHTLTVTKDGYEPYSRQLLVKKGQTETIRVDLASASIQESGKVPTTTAPASIAKQPATKPVPAGPPDAATLAAPGEAVPADPLALLTDHERSEGWISMFDGQTLFGWKATSEADWGIEDGTIVVTGGDRGLLYASTRFANYVLKVDFRSEKGTDSGILLHSPPNLSDPEKDCYELSIADSDNPFPTGSLVKRQKAEGNIESTDWQSFEVSVDDAEVAVKLDGELILQYVDPQPLGRGRIGLQFNEGKVAFRNIRLKPLGMTDIFNGKDLTGWKTYSDMTSKFSVTDEGCLNVKDGRGQLETERQYGDFVLQLECITHAPKVNSGMFFRCIPGDVMMGYECQIHNGFENDDRTQPSDCGTGGIFRRQNARRVVANDLEWFHETLIADGPRIAAWVNGYQVSDWTDEREPHENPRKGLRLEAGTIIIQGHDATTDISFRNLRIAEM